MKWITYLILGLLSMTLVLAQETKRDISIIDSAPPETYVSNIISEDDTFEGEIEYLGNNFFEFTVHNKQEKQSIAIEWSATLCTNQTRDIKASGRTLNKRKSDNRYCDEQYPFPHELLVKQQRGLPTKLNFEIPEGVKDFKLYLGNGTYVSVISSTDNGQGGSDGNFHNQLHYDKYTKRWYTFYLNNNGDPFIISADHNDQGTWTVGDSITTASTSDYEDVDCALQDTGSLNRLYCVVTSGNAQTLALTMFNLTNTTPFEEKYTTFNIFESTAYGGASSDDVSLPRIEIDSNGCYVVAFNMEDDSEATANEHEIVLIKESNSTCGGDPADKNANTLDGAFPIFSVQTSTGFNFDSPVGIDLFDNDDVQLAWIDTDSVTSADLETVYINMTSYAIGTEVELNADIEYNTFLGAYDIQIAGDKTLIFGLDDATTDLDAYIINEKGGGLSNKVDTGMNTPAPSNIRFGFISAIYNTNTSNVHLFSPASLAEQISGTIGNASNNYTNWYNNTIVLDQSSSTTSNQNIFAVSSDYNYEACVIGLRYSSTGGAGGEVIFGNHTVQGCNEPVGDPDNTPPGLISTDVNPTTETGGTVNFNINESANYTMEYGIFLSFGNIRSNSSFSTHHNTSIGGFTNNTLIYYNVTLCDAAENCAEYGTFNWTTDQSTPPGADSCTPSGASDHTFQCSDDCKIAEIDFSNNDVVINGSGTFSWVRNITNAAKISIRNGCNAYG